MLALDPSNSVAYFNRGSTFDNMGRNDEAVADFTRALELDHGSGSGGAAGPGEAGPGSAPSRPAPGQLHQPLSSAQSSPMAAWQKQGAAAAQQQQQQQQGYSSRFAR